jgi:signal transduction histidine kinase
MKENVDHEIKQIPLTYGPSIGAAIWSFNDEALVSSVNGLLQKDIIAGVHIDYSSQAFSVGLVKNDDTYNNYNVEGKKKNEEVSKDLVNSLSEHQYPILFKSLQDEVHTVGIMTIYISHNIFLEEIKRNLLLIVSNSLVILLVLTIIATIFLKRIITTPLDHLVNEIDKISFSNLDNSFILSISKDDDEIRHLEHSFNNLISKLIISKQELSTMNSRLEEEVKDRTADLIGALEQAKLSSKAKSQFLANMSHELRTPLNAITGFSSIMVEEIGDLSLPPEHVENLKNINFSAEHLSQIVNDILSLSKIESGKMSLDIGPCKLSEVCETVYSMTKHLALDKGINFSLLCEDECKVMIESDETKLKQILLNLLSNAIKFTPINGEIIFKTSITKERQIVFSVQDNGIGVEEEKVGLIFQEFEQAEMSTTKKFGGTGLGLSISKKLVNMLNGDINVTSKINEGSTFFVSIPLTLAEVANELEKEILNPSIEGLNFLVFEDNKINQKLITKLLSKSGATCQIADDGVIGLSILEKEMPDVILMDLHMPNMNGIEATKEIRKKFNSTELPIFALSADIMEESIEDTKKAGMNGFLSKPIQMQTLKQAVAKTKRA